MRFAYPFGAALLGLSLMSMSLPTLARPAAPAPVVVPLTGADVVLAFSPNGPATDLIVQALRGARRQVLVQAYGFSAPAILQALGQAKDRGVDVRIILDKSNRTAKYSGATYVANHGIPVWIDDSVRIAHNKVMIIDGRDVITGSFNFTKSAQDGNTENLLWIRNSPTLANQYIKNWNWRVQLSKPYR